MLNCTVGCDSLDETDNEELATASKSGQYKNVNDVSSNTDDRPAAASDQQNAAASAIDSQSTGALLSSCYTHAASK